MTWLDQYHVHPACRLFPMMGDEELADLGKDIEANGLRQPILVMEPKPDALEQLPILLDGRNRLAAMEYLKLPGRHEAETRTAETDDPVGLVASLNLKRRHLTTAQKREIIAALLKIAPERSNRQVAKDVGVDHKTVGAVREQAEASGEIPQSPKRVGKDGRKTKATKPKPVSVTVTTTFPVVAKLDEALQALSLALDLLKKGEHGEDNLILAVLCKVDAIKAMVSHINVAAMETDEPTEDSVHAEDAGDDPTEGDFSNIEDAEVIEPEPAPQERPEVVVLAPGESKEYLAVAMQRILAQP